MLFSVQGRLRLRYLEAFTPAVAAALGIGLVLVVADLARRRGWAPQWTSRFVALLAAALLIWPFTTSVRLIQAGTEDSQRLGAIPAAQVDLLSWYLSAHQSGVRYQLASSRTTIAAPLIVRDAQPVLMLNAHQLARAPADLAIRAHGESAHRTGAPPPTGRDGLP